MALYRYRAYNEQGKIFTGFIEAGYEAEAIELIKEKNFAVIDLKSVKTKTGKAKPTLGLLPFFKKVKIKEVVVFSRQLSVMTSATIPIVQALKIVSQQTTNPLFAKIILEIANDVDGGTKLSMAMSRYPQVFSRFFISMIKSGETSGKIDEVSTYLADQMEKDYDLVSKIKGAMIYPVFIVCGLFIVGTLMMIFVIPKLTEMLIESGTKLPFTTRLLISVSDFMRNQWWLLIILIFGGFTFLNLFIKSEYGRRQTDLIKIYLPVFGKLFQRIYIVRLCRSLSTLLIGGVPLTVSLEVTKEVVGNAYYQDLIEETIKEVEDGNPIATIFMKSKTVPSIVSQMMNIGEKTGRLDEILEKVAGFYQREVDNIVQNLASLIEPIVMLVIGAAVGVMVSAIILPMYQMANTF